MPFVGEKKFIEFTRISFAHCERSVVIQCVRNMLIHLPDNVQIYENCLHNKELVNISKSKKNRKKREIKLFSDEENESDGEKTGENYFDHLNHSQRRRIATTASQ